MRRAAAHALALAGRGVAGAYPGADVDVGQALRAQGRPYALERRLEVLLDVIRQRLEWRDIDHLGLIRQAAVEPLADQRVDGGEKGGERLAGAGGCGDEHV